MTNLGEQRVQYKFWADLGVGLDDVDLDAELAAELEWMAEDSNIVIERADGCITITAPLSLLEGVIEIVNDYDREQIIETTEGLMKVD